MDLSGPKRLSWWLALLIWVGVALGLVGIIAHIAPIAALAAIDFWLLAIGFVLLAVASAVIYLRVLKSS